MKVKSFYYRSSICAMILGASLCGTISSCGESKKSDNSYTLTPETTAIKGDLSDYYEVVSKEYTTTDNYRTIMDDMHAIITVEIKRTDKEFDFDPQSTFPMGTLAERMTGNAGFGIEILDETGNIISKSAATNGGIGGMYSCDDMKEALKLKAGETATVRWQMNFEDNDKPVKFRITSAYEKSGYIGETTEITKNSSSANNWDSILDSYEKYVDKYCVIYKKVQNGDMAAAAEMASMLEKAQELQNKLENAESELTPSQATRLTKINSKLIEAI